MHFGYIGLNVLFKINFICLFLFSFLLLPGNLKYHLQSYKFFYWTALDLAFLHQGLCLSSY
jgi:hypothetical protein